MARQIKTKEEYMSRLLKLIPSEIVAAYIAIQGIIPETSKKWGLIIVGLILLIITPFYLKKVMRVDKISQIIVSSLAFVIWVYSLGGPFVYLNIFEPWIASVILILWTTFIPQFFRPKES